MQIAICACCLILRCDMQRIMKESDLILWITQVEDRIKEAPRGDRTVVVENVDGATLTEVYGATLCS